MKWNDLVTEIGGFLADSNRSCEQSQDSPSGIGIDADDPVEEPADIH